MVVGTAPPIYNCLSLLGIPPMVTDDDDDDDDQLMTMVRSTKNLSKDLSSFSQIHR